LGFPSFLLALYFAFAPIENPKQKPQVLLTDIDHWDPLVIFNLSPFELSQRAPRKKEVRRAPHGLCVSLWLERLRVEGGEGAVCTSSGGGLREGKQPAVAGGAGGRACVPLLEGRSRPRRGPSRGRACQRGGRSRRVHAGTARGEKGAATEPCAKQWQLLVRRCRQLLSAEERSFRMDRRSRAAASLRTLPRFLACVRWGLRHEPPFSHRNGFG
jgi:hypothetical protein